MSSGPEPHLRSRSLLTSCGLVIAAACALPALAGPHEAARLPPKTERLVAIGDIHGDFDAFIGLLTRVGLIDAERRWAGGDTTLVQTGDYMDRGPKVREVLDYLIALEPQAAACGGRAIVLMGNHEASNAIGSVRDVPASAYASFADAGSEGRRQAAYEAQVKLAEARRAGL